jgi:alpha-glucosidase (family GH31 glycosyl hydrolase)
VARKYLGMKYMLHSYMYTGLYMLHKEGGALWRALWHDFPRDRRTHDIDRQFMVGPALLVSPVLAPGVGSLDACVACDWPGCRSWAVIGRAVVRGLHEGLVIWVIE